MRELKEQADQRIKDKYYQLVLKRAKIGRKVTNHELAVAAGCHTSTVSRWTSNTYIPSVDVLYPIEDYLDSELEKYDA